MSDAIKAKLEKLANMAARAEGNERANAERLFDAALKRHGFRREDFLNPDAQLVETQVTIKTMDEERLLRQIIAFVTDQVSVRLFRYRFKARTRGFEATKAQSAEVVFLYAIYRKAYATELKRLYSAFLHKHSLFPPTDTREEKYEKVSAEEMRRLQSMVDGLNKLEVRKAIGSTP